jgi:hypothetical protein
MLLANIDSVPAELIKHVITLALAFGGFWFAHKRSQQGSKDQPVNIAQPLTVAKHDDTARRSEVAKIEASLKTFGERVDSLAEQMNAQFTAMTKAGQDRAAAITQSIDEEVGTLSNKLSTLASVLHEKINAAIVDNAKQGSDIGHLQSDTFRHTQEIAAIRQAIADLIRNGSSKKH